MKNLLLIICIIIIIFKTGNVFSDNNIFNVNNIELNKKTSKNKDYLVNLAFKRAFDQLLDRILLEEDHKKFSNTKVNEIQKLVSYYQIIDPDENDIDNNKTIVNISFDKEKIHNIFYQKNIKYSDTIKTEIILFPLLKKDNQIYIYNNNFFYENWKKQNFNDLIEYTLPLENIENIQKINLIKNSIYNLDINNFFKEYSKENLAFVNIEIKKENVEVFLKARIEGNNINKSFSIKKDNTLNEKEFFVKIIFDINDFVRDLIKSQNLIDVRTPSFLNAKIKIDNKKDNLVEFDKRVKQIDLIDNFHVLQLNKDYILIKIKYLGKIDKIIDKLNSLKVKLQNNAGQWQLDII